MYRTDLIDHKVNIINAISYWGSLAFLRLLLAAGVISNSYSAPLMGERILWAPYLGWVRWQP